MRFKNYTILLMLLFTLLCFNVAYAAEKPEIVDLNSAYSYLSDDYYTKAIQLVEKYPDILYLEVLGQSYDGKPIYVVIMTENTKETLKRDDLNVYRMHYLIEAGTHARETVNPAIVLKIIEDYAIDYYNDGHIKEFNVKDELSIAVIQFIHLLNPDGHDLAKIGLASVETEVGKQIINSIKDKNYSEWKANLRGVDINRNFPDRYLDKTTKQWIEKWQKYPAFLYSKIPSGSYYPGPYAGSETETQILMNYMTRYDFRNYLTYHSRGQVVYYDWYYAPETFNNRAYVLGEIVNNITGYGIQSTTTGNGSGYDNEYFSANLLKPGITVETVSYSVKTPIPQEYYRKTYDLAYLLPLYFVKAGREAGYNKYRLYVNNNYVRDYFDYDYALAHMKDLGGEIIEGEGTPKMHLVEPEASKELELWPKGLKLLQEYLPVLKIIQNS